MKKIAGILACAISLVFSFSCKKDTKPQTHDTVTQVSFNYRAYLNGYPLVLNSPTFAVNEHGDSVNVTKFNYYISNIKLTRDDGQVFLEQESYHLISHENPSSTTFSIHDVPPGNYKKMEFVIGVDSLRNCSGIQQGALDPANYMFWNWNSGYIFLKLEGRAKTIANPVPSVYTMHTGGYKLPFNCIRNVSITLPSLTIADQAKPVVYFNVLVDEIFKTPLTVDMDNYMDVAGGQKSSSICTNYADMFVLDHISN